jgi:tetratricopeptide (TPR) repeat protein
MMRRGRCPALLAVLTLLAGPLAAQRVKMLVPLDSLIARAQRDSMDAPSHYELGIGYWVSRRFDLADQQLRRAIAIEPHLAEAYLALGYLPYAMREKLWDDEEKNKVPAEWLPKLEEASQFRRQAFLLNPLVDLKPLALMIPPASVLGLHGNAEAAYTWVMNGFGSFWDGQYERAYSFFSTIAQSGGEANRPRFASWFLWYEALAAAHAREYSRAEADLRLLLARADSMSTLDGGAALGFSKANHYRYALGCVLDMEGKAPEAVSTLQEALTNDAGLYMAHVRLALILDDQHRPRSALEERRRAVAANPEDATLLFDLGEALATAGEFAEAQGVLRQARTLNPQSVRALYVLGFVASRVGNSDEARDAYSHFLAIAPSRFAEQITEVKQRLAALPAAAP